MAIDLEFITTATGDDGRYNISGIPDKLWEVFKEAAQKAMPEKGELAWASVLTEIIQKHVIGDVYTYIMTDIPQEARNAFEQTAGQADLTVDHIIGLMFRQAQEGKLHILNMISPEGSKEGYRTVVIAGLSEPGWQKWAEVAKGVGFAPEELIGMTFEAAATGHMSLTPYPEDAHKAKFEPRESND